MDAARVGKSRFVTTPRAARVYRFLHARVRTEDRVAIELIRKLLMEKFPAAGVRVRAGRRGVEFVLRWPKHGSQRLLVARWRFERGQSAEEILTPLALNYLWLGHSLRADASGKLIVEDAS